MSYENIKISSPNVCIGPQAGTFCTIDTTVFPRVLKLINSSGNVINTFSFVYSNIVDELKDVEYLGPTNLTSLINGLEFLTSEKVSDSSCIIKIWRTNITNSSLELERQFVKFNSGDYHYNLLSVATEVYRRTFSSNMAFGLNYLYINNASTLTNGVRLLLGPSTYVGSPGVSEFVTVNYVVGNKVYINENLTYNYLSGDSITFYPNLYLFSSTGYGSSSGGTVYKLNSLTGLVTNLNSSGLYSNVQKAKWCSYYNNIAIVLYNNLLFINGLSGYVVSRSLILDNIEDDGVNYFSIHDIVFDSNTLYKLTTKINRYDDSGIKTTYSWTNYNFVSDILASYVASIHISGNKLTTIGQVDSIELSVKVTDQFGVGLRDVLLYFYKISGDTQAVFNPISGQTTTDINGEATINYVSGNIYNGLTFIKCKSYGGSSLKGSSWVWSSLYINSTVTYSVVVNNLRQKSVFYSINNLLRQLNYIFSTELSIRSFSYFTSLGGNWIPDGLNNEAKTYLPSLIIGDLDGPRYLFSLPSPPWSIEDLPDNICDTIRQLANSSIEIKARQQKEFVVDYDEEGNFILPNIVIYQYKQKESTIFSSQLKHSKHSHWSGDIYYSTLLTETELNQFIFVQEAVPTFYSIKNPISTYIWLRLLPYGFDLDGDTFQISIREVSYNGDTDYYDITNQGTITYFDAGGGLNGIEFYYQPPIVFNYNSLIYVRFELRDKAAIPNEISKAYWFMTIPDYRAPYLDNLIPSRDQTNVAKNTPISFDIKDQGVGVDINTLEILINHVRCTSFTTTRISKNHYYISCSGLVFDYDKEVTVNVVISDLASPANIMNDFYRFYIVESSGILFAGNYPDLCKRGVSRYTNVQILVLGAGNGVDRDTIIFQVDDKTINNYTTIPVVYRIS